MEDGQPAVEALQRSTDATHAPPAGRARGSERHRKGEVQVLAQSVESSVDLGQGGSALEDEVRLVACQVLQKKGAEEILLDGRHRECRDRRV